MYSQLSVLSTEGGKSSDFKPGFPTQIGLKLAIIDLFNLCMGYYFSIAGIQFNCHKTVLMTTSRYFDTMLTLFDERSKSEVELKDFVDPRSSSSHVFTILESTIFFTKFSFNLFVTSKIETTNSRI